MFFAACAFAVLCLASAFSPCPDPCYGVVKPARPQDLPPLHGRWIAVAFSEKIVRREPNVFVDRSDSFTLHFLNATFLTTKLQGEVCKFQKYNAPLRGVHFNDTLKARDDPKRVTVFFGTLLHSSCADCLMISFNIKSPTYEVQTLTMYRRDRQVKHEQLQEFLDIADCMKYPRPVLMDPKMKLCIPTQDLNGDVTKVEQE